MMQGIKAIKTSLIMRSVVTAARKWGEELTESFIKSPLAATSGEVNNLFFAFLCAEKALSKTHCLHQGALGRTREGTASALHTGHKV